MAVVLCMVSVFWGMVTRKYLQDVFQERNIVYFGGLYVVLQTLFGPSTADSCRRAHTVAG